MGAAARGMERVREDFDRIALASEPAGEQFTSGRGDYLGWLLRHVPSPCPRALDLGCGTGELTRRIARVADHVLALDLSPEMIRVARLRSAGFHNVEYRVADFTRTPLEPGAYDCVASVAALHHLPAARALSVMRDALRPGGVLLLQDVLSWLQPTTLPVAAMAALVRVLRGEPWHGSPALREAWRRHGAGERHLRPAEVKALVRRELPGAELRFHLLWRYSVVWRKPLPRATES